MGGHGLWSKEQICLKGMWPLRELESHMKTEPVPKKMGKWVSAAGVYFMSTFNSGNKLNSTEHPIYNKH